MYPITNLSSQSSPCLEIITVPENARRAINFQQVNFFGPNDELVEESKEIGDIVDALCAVFNEAKNIVRDDQMRDVLDRTEFLSGKSIKEYSEAKVNDCGIWAMFCISCYMEDGYGMIYTEALYTTLKNAICKFLPSADQVIGVIGSAHIFKHEDSIMMALRIRV